MISEKKIRFSLIIPCFNEENAVKDTVEEIVQKIGEEKNYEIIIVNDGSTDNTKSVLAELAPRYTQVKVLEHEENRGYGAALKTGIRCAGAELIAITDADGTYPNERIAELVDLCADYDMVVGARIGDNVQYSKIRAIPKFFLTQWVSWLADRNVPDINSGLRVFRKNIAENYFNILSDKFSFTITITLAMVTTYRQVVFLPIDYQPRIGKSKIKPIRDTLRFMSVILRTGMYFAPIRAFAPIFCSLLLLAVISLGYDIFFLKDLTDKTVLLFLFSMNVAMFALIADMIDKRMH